MLAWSQRVFQAGRTSMGKSNHIGSLEGNDQCERLVLLLFRLQLVGDVFTKTTYGRERSASEKCANTFSCRLTSNGLNAGVRWSDFLSRLLFSLLTVAMSI